MVEELTPLPLQRLFTSKAVARVLDFILAHRGFDYTKSDISREADVDWKNLYERVWPVLEKYALVKPTRRVGRATLYTANLDNPIVPILIKLMAEIAHHDNQPLVEEARRAAAPKPSP